MPTIMEIEKKFSNAEKQHLISAVDIMKVERINNEALQNQMKAEIDEMKKQLEIRERNLVEEITNRQLLEQKLSAMKLEMEAKDEIIDNLQESVAALTNYTPKNHDPLKLIVEKLDLDKSLDEDMFDITEENIPEKPEDELNVKKEEIPKVPQPLEKKQVCNECGKRFCQKRALIQHKIDMHEFGSYPCHFCPKSFTSKRYLTSHEAKHYGKLFRCTKCSDEFGSRGKRDAHSKTCKGI
jgi:hypothetical protein